jgi:hypothetical protein
MKSTLSYVRMRNERTIRYSIRIPGLEVYDTLTGSPALINDVSQTSLPLEDADDLGDLLNHLRRMIADDLRSVGASVPPDACIRC